MKRILHIGIAALAAIIALSSCVKHHNIDIPEGQWGKYRGNVAPDGLVKGGTVTPKQIMEFIGDIDLNKEVKYTVDGGTQEFPYSTAELKKQLKYDVDFYIVTFYTQYGLDGSKMMRKKLVYSRALMLVPKGLSKEETRLAVYCHGTVLPVPEITTLFDMGTPADFTGDNGSQDVRFCALPLASAGYVVVCPEYTGYGPTAGMDHPFVYYPELIMSASDGLHACVKALEDPDFGLNYDFRNKNTGKRDVYLCGWSQGGGLALYMQKEMENNAAYSYGYNVKATSTIAGPFNIYRFLTEMLQNSNKTYLLMALYGWAGYSINMFCPDLQRPMDLIFRPSIFDQRDAFILFGNTPGDLFQEFFSQHILDGTDEEFIKVLYDDSTYKGWSPKAPVFLHHGSIDNVVPCFNSEDAYNGLKDSAQGGISLFKYTGENHTTFVPAYMSRTIDEFNSIQ